MPIASYIHKYFWDINPKKAAPKTHPEYYINRILELGDKRSISWLKKVFGLKKIKQVASKSRISPKSKNYWKINL